MGWLIILENGVEIIKFYLIVRFYLMDYHDVPLLPDTFGLTRVGLSGDTFRQSWLALFVCLIHPFPEGAMSTV